MVSAEYLGHIILESLKIKTYSVACGPVVDNFISEMEYKYHTVHNNWS